MFLLVDAGNSRIKWCVWHEGAQRSGVVQISEDVFTAGAWALQLGEELVSSVGAIYVSSVRGDAFRLSFDAFCLDLFNVLPIYASVDSDNYGVRVGYSDPSLLGVDRWLAMLAAYRGSAEGVVVIDAGTAITVDYVDSCGDHLGGLIVPGVQAMASSLLINTREISIESLTLPQIWGPGCDTLSCVEQGVAASLKGLMAEVVACAHRISPPGSTATIYLTGGDASILKSWLPSGVVVEPLLVFHGLLLSQKLG
ncbi:type III pantothenate kinase [Teredinibacter purpureus]|uniref:type III pantothenate kinase n=1 Tax=Teredinibacter purpureus TaxID=2731756 RepID=UPI00069670F1|nr:type III pantothenate kinase [Teredinibacter purpureus]